MLIEDADNLTKTMNKRPKLFEFMRDPIKNRLTMTTLHDISYFTFFHLSTGVLQ